MHYVITKTLPPNVCLSKYILQFLKDFIFFLNASISEFIACSTNLYTTDLTVSGVFQILGFKSSWMRFCFSCVIYATFEPFFWYFCGFNNLLYCPHKRCLNVRSSRFMSCSCIPSGPTVIMGKTFCSAFLIKVLKPISLSVAFPGSCYICVLPYVSFPKLLTNHSMNMRQSLLFFKM